MTRFPADPSQSAATGPERKENRTFLTKDIGVVVPSISVTIAFIPIVILAEEDPHRNLEKIHRFTER